MLARFRIRRIVTSWFLSIALVMLSAAVVFADGGGTPIPH